MALCRFLAPPWLTAVFVCPTVVVASAGCVARWGRSDGHTAGQAQKTLTARASLVNGVVMLEASTLRITALVRFSVSKSALGAVVPFPTSRVAEAS